MLTENLTSEGEQYVREAVREGGLVALEVWKPAFDLDYSSEPEFKEGQRVHIDTDDEEWGRVSSDGEVLDTSDDEVFVCVDSINANIWVPLEDVTAKEE